MKVKMRQRTNTLRNWKNSSRLADQSVNVSSMPKKKPVKSKSESKKSAKQKKSGSAKKPRPRNGPKKKPRQPLKRLRRNLQTRKRCKLMSRPLARMRK